MKKLTKTSRIAICKACQVYGNGGKTRIPIPHTCGMEIPLNASIEKIDIGFRSITQLAQAAHQNARDKGFYDRPRNTGEMIALMHSELSEALEADRADSYCTQPSIYAVNAIPSDEDFKRAYKESIKGTFEEEMADLVIRALDMCAHKAIDLEQHIEAKMRYNSMREKYHGKKY